MESTITLTMTPQNIIWFVIAVLVIVLLVYIILFVRKLIDTLKTVDTILADGKDISVIANKRTHQVDEMVDNIGESVGSVVSAVKGVGGRAVVASAIKKAKNTKKKKK